jgi:hypothetical protein
VTVLAAPTAAEVIAPPAAPAAEVIALPAAPAAEVMAPPAAPAAEVMAPAALLADAPTLGKVTTPAPAGQVGSMAVVVSEPSVRTMPVEPWAAAEAARPSRLSAVKRILKIG